MHPDLRGVSLSAALHALSDPVRLQLVMRLSRTPCVAQNAIACSPHFPKSTISNHIRILRGAGLVRTTSAGRYRMSELRRDEFDDRFPGLLEAVLANAGPAEVRDEAPDGD